MSSYQREPGSDDLLDPEVLERLSEIPEPDPYEPDDVEHTRDDEPRDD